MLLASHRYTIGEGPRETRSERDFSPMSGEKKMFLQYNSADRQRHFNICLRAILANHSQPGTYLNIDERFPLPLIKP